MPDLYEFGITGSIGPIIRSCLPDLATVAERRSTVLTGTVQGPEELQRLLDLLCTNGSPALNVRITYHDEDVPGTMG